MISGSNLNISTANFKSNLTPADKTTKTNLAKEQTQASKNKEDVKRQIQIYLNERNFICFIAKLFIRNFFIIFRVVKHNPVLQIDSSFF